MGNTTIFLALVFEDTERRDDPEFVERLSREVVADLRECIFDTNMKYAGCAPDHLVSYPHSSMNLPVGDPFDF